MPTLKATKVDNHGDRVLIYGHPKWDDYHVIAPANTDIKQGDEVEYKSGGWNFGWLISVNKVAHNK